jgi:hypothetical protein
VKSENVISPILNAENTFEGKSEINIAAEIVSTEEYNINYAYVNLALLVDSQLVEDFNSKCDYDTLYELIREITYNHTEEILMEALNQSGLNELLENDFDWFNCDPTIRITELSDVNIGALYDSDQNYQVAELLGVDEDVAEERAMSLRDDLRCGVDRELLLKIIKQ